MKSTLLVTSDPAAKLRLLRILGRHGWWVDAVDGIEGALLFLRGRPRDMVLIDWEIENGSGLALLRAIKADPRWGSVPVVMMHEGVWCEELERAFALGANDFLLKPFTERSVLLGFDRWVIDSFGRTSWELAG